MMQEKECTDIWRKYQAGKDHHNKANMYTLTEKCHRFYEGDNSPDTATKVYIEQDLTCTNAQCANHGKIVEQRRAYLIGQA